MLTITARVLSNQNTGSNAMAGVMIRSTTGFDVAATLMIFDGGAQSSIYEHRANAADLALYGLKTYGESFGNEDEAEATPSGGWWRQSDHCVAAGKRAAVGAARAQRQHHHQLHLD